MNVKAIVGVLAACLVLAVPFAHAQLSPAAPDDAAFAAIAKTYREAAIKPLLPEEARVYQVQAEGAIQAKDFDAAADLYSRALTIAPWWPAGHSNRALILAERQQLSTAIFEMKRYLMLAPEAADARAAQDKIYLWDGMLERAVGEMVAIPAGTFTMGSPGNEQGRAKDEGPQHQVSIQGFEIGKYDVTRGQWAAFVAAAGRAPASDDCDAFTGGKWVKGASWLTPGFSQTDRDPVVCVSWNDAQDYLRWLSSVTGKTYRLPTEAEWEYAARAGTGTAYFWGNTFDPGRAANNKAGTEPFGAHPPNAFGLYDMSGNAWQYVGDCYQDSYKNASSDGSAVTAGECSHRVVRGGNWVGSPTWLRSATREKSLPTNRCSCLGFRAARTP